MSQRLITARRVLAAGFGVVALVAGAAPGRTDGSDGDGAETYHSSVDGRTYRVLRDDVTGAKRLEAADGTRFESVADLMAAEDAALSRLERALPKDLLDRVRNAAPADDEMVDLVVRFHRHPAGEAADVALARHGPRLDGLLARSREILGALGARRTVGDVPDPREEETLLTPGERAERESLRAEIRGLQHRMRREIVESARAAALEDQRAVVGRIERTGGALLLGQSFILSTVSARLPLRDLVPLLDAHPEVARIEPVVQHRPSLDVSVPVVGANTWWSVGYNGSSSTIVGILDTGVDSSHPALQGLFAAESVHLTAGAQDSQFADNASSTDDLFGHGTHVAGIVASNDSTTTGVAPGVKLLNAKCGYVTTTWASLQDPDIFDAGDWAATNGADVLNGSFGSGGSSNGNSSMTLFMDAAVADLGIAVAISAGNSGSSSNTVSSPADGFNVFGVGNWDDNGTTSLSDDSITSSSSRGPCDDGRRKPDISAPGNTINSCDAFWETSGSRWINFTGTSMAAPHVAGGLALLIDAGVAAYPEGLKALLLTNARNSSPFPTTPDNTWGCGAMDLSAAYTNRASVYEGTLTPSGPRFVFLRPGALATGSRVTLAWNRRVVSNGSSAPTTRSALLDLDLYVYDESNGSSLGTSTTALNSVEQVKSTGSTNTPVVKVHRGASSFPSGLSSQRFSVAAEVSSKTSVVTAPSLACTFTTLPAQIAGSTNFTLTVNVANSGGLAAQQPSVTLALPSGYTIPSGSATQTLSQIGASGSANATWTVRSAASGTGTKTFSATATSASYGETFTSPQKTAVHLLDADAPTGSVTLAGGAATSTSLSMTAAFAGSDTGSGVAEMRFRPAGDSWGSWVPFAASAQVTLTGAEGTKTLEAQVRDAVGNVSATVTDTIVVDSAASSGTVTVAGGAAWTTTASVTLSLTANGATSGIADMRFSNDGATWTSYAAFSPTASFTLTGADGTKTVYAQFRNAAGTLFAAAADSIGLDRVAPQALLVTNPWSASPDITLAMQWAADTSGIESMRFSNDGTKWTSWAAFTATQSTPATVSWTLPDADGAHTVRAQTRDVAGNVSGVATSQAGIDRVAPSGSLALAGGAVWATSTQVTVQPSGTDALSGVGRMRFSDDGTNWANWVTYAQPAPDWTLPGQDGAKTVYVQYEDLAGNLSAAVSAGVLLDRSAPWGTIAVAGGAQWTPSLTVAVDVTAQDFTSGVADLRLLQDGTPWSAWIPFTTKTTFALSGADGTKNVWVQFRDVAGNESLAVYDGIALDTVAPLASIVLAGGVQATSAAIVPAALGWFDAGSGVFDMQFSTDSGATWTDWQRAETLASFTLQDRDGWEQVRVRFRDVAGNVSKFAYDDILVDRTPPSASLVIADGASVLLPGRPLVAQVSVDDGPESSGIAGFRWSRDGGATWSPWGDASEGTVALDAGPELSDVRLDIHGQFRDVAGNLSAPATDTIYVLAPALQDANDAASVRGKLDKGGDVDAYRIDLLKGDRFDARVTAKALGRGAPGPVELDLFTPDGAQVVSGRFPARSKKTGIANFAAPATGTYVLVLRGTGPRAPQGASYVLSTAIRAGRTKPIVGKGSAAIVAIPFDGAAGRVLTGTVRGASLKDAVLQGPVGEPILVTMRGARGRYTLPKLVLARGSGAYVVRVAGGGAVTWSFKLAPGKRAGSVAEQQAP